MNRIFVLYPLIIFSAGFMIGAFTEHQIGLKHKDEAIYIGGPGGGWATGGKIIVNIPECTDKVYITLGSAGGTGSAGGDVSKDESTVYGGATGFNSDAAGGAGSGISVYGIGQAAPLAPSENGWGK